MFKKIWKRNVILYSHLSWFVQDAICNKDQTPKILIFLIYWYILDFNETLMAW